MTSPTARMDHLKRTLSPDDFLREPSGLSVPSLAKRQKRARDQIIGRVGYEWKKIYRQMLIKPLSQSCNNLHQPVNTYGKKHVCLDTQMCSFCSAIPSTNSSTQRQARITEHHILQKPP